MTVELKNDIEISGSLAAVDQNLNLYLSKISVKDAEKFPQFVLSPASSTRSSLSLAASSEGTR